MKSAAMQRAWNVGALPFMEKNIPITGNKITPQGGYPVIAKRNSNYANDSEFRAGGSAHSSFQS